MATAKKPAPKSAWAAAAPKATAKEKAHFEAVLNATAPAKKPAPKLVTRQIKTAADVDTMPVSEKDKMALKKFLASALPAKSVVAQVQQLSADALRIKKMYAALAKAAVSAITKDSPGHVGASNRLHLYAERHAAWVEATAEAFREQTAVSARRAEARFKKLEQLHNNFVWSAVRDEHGDIQEKLKKLSLKGKAANDAAYKKLNAEQEDLIAKALQASGIGARNIYSV